MSFIETMISDLCNLALEAGFAGSLTKTLAQYNPTTNNTIINLMKNSVFAIGASLLTLFMLIELVAMVNRSSGDNGLGSIKLPVNILIKFGIFAFLFCHIPQILTAIEETAVNVGNGMITGAIYTFGVGVSTSQVTMIANAIDNLDFFNKIFTYIVVFVCWIFIHLVEAIISITTVFRIFELWLLLLFSPIPLSTFVSQEFRPTALNFLKNFTAVSLQGTAIIACFMIYHALIASFIIDYDPATDISKFINSFLLQNIIYTAVLAVSVFSSGRIIKQIMNAV